MTAVNRTITADLPTEPAEGSVVLDKNQRAWQHLQDGPRRADDTIAAWAPTGAAYGAVSAATWIDLCHLAPLTVVWEPGAQPDQDGHDDALVAKQAELAAAEAVTKAGEDVQLATRELDLARRRLFAGREEQLKVARR